MAHLTPERVQELYDTYGELRVLDDIIRHRAGDNPPAPILGYPKNENNVDEYESFTGQQIDVFVDNAVKYYIKNGLKPNQREVVGIFAPSNVDFLVTFFALSRLGYTVLCISLRLPPVAIINIIKKTKTTIIARGDSPQIAATTDAVNKEFPINPVLIAPRSVYRKERAAGEEPFVRKFDREAETNEIGLVMHSSGSTGLPKPVFLSHKNVLTHPVQGAGMHNFGALPLYHMYGLSTTLQAMYWAKTANLLSATLPITADTLMGALEATQPEVFHAVPYALGLLVEHPRAMNYLKSAKLVTAAGARTPDELGDRLVEGGVKFGVVFGTTEAGLLGDTMRREDGDDSWSYVRIYSNIRDSIKMEPIGDGQYEALYLRSHPGLFVDNGEDASGPWHSKDVFIPHPTIKDVWKYVTRIDDRVTLSNGEKVLPLPIEGRIRQEDIVREAIVVGVDRPIPGVLLIRASDDLPTQEFIDAVWPAVQDANSRAEGFSQILKDMITILPAGTEYPRTDKGSIIRAQAYKQFADIIDEMYDTEQEGTLKLDLPGIEEFLLKTYEEVMETPLASIDTDFFSAGVDSLKSIQYRRAIQRTLDLNGTQLSSNIVFENGDIKTLAKYLFSLSEGKDAEAELADRTPLMRQLIQKYSTFGETAILTGSTGSLGAHALAQMVNDPAFKKVYCLVRGEDPLGRVYKSLKERGLELDEFAKSKIVALTADPSLDDFGLGNEMVEQFRSEISLIVHLAWPVNFNIPLQSFEPHLAGLRNLLDLSLSVRQTEPARVWYASSISAAEKTPQPCLIPNEVIENFKYAIPMGYAQSKLAGEHIVRNAVRSGARAYALRIGQIVGDREHGFWNDGEFVPSMLRSALSMKTLPILDEECSWIPADTLATAILQMDQKLKSGSRPGLIDNANPPILYNMTNPHFFSWEQLLEELSRSGLEFKAVSFGDWLQQLRESAAEGNEKINPAVKLLGHFEERYKTVTENEKKDKTNGAREDGANGNQFNKGIVFDTTAVLRDSTILREPPNIIKDGYVQQFLTQWMKKWTSE